ncbi:hypothetical protein [Galenea microaerophila]
MTSPLKKALQNSLLITAIVGLVVHLQGETIAAGMMTMIYTEIILFPSLYFAYRYTSRLRKKMAESEKSNDHTQSQQQD